MIPVKLFFAWAEEQGLVHVNPAKPVKTPRDHNHVPRRLSAEVCAKLLHVADFRATTIIYLGLHLGLRACEISRSNIEDWDRPRETLLVHGKGAKQRVLPVVGEMAMALDMWTTHLDVRRGPMFPGQNCERISPAWVSNIVTQTARVARVNATTHMLRHTCASDLVARGVPMPVIQQVMGHSSLATTTRYVVASADELRDHVGGTQLPHRAGGVMMDGQTPIGEAFEEWVQARVARREINTTTARSYRHSLGLFADYLGADTPLAAVNTDAFEAWLAAQQVEASTLNTRAASTRAFFRWAAKRRIVAYDPTDSVRRARVGQHEARKLDDDTIKRMLLVADFRQTVFILLGVGLGLRCMEIAGMRIADWDRRNETLLVHGKGNKQRTLPVPAELAEVLDLWIGGRRTGPVFPSMHNKGAAITANTVSANIGQVAKRAEVTASAHQLRHSYASNLVAAGVPLPTVQRVLGHELIATTTTYVRATAAT